MATPTHKPNTAPAFQFYPSEFLSSSKVQRMSLIEVGIYTKLLCHCWLDNGLPTDTKKLARMVGMRPAQFEHLWPNVLAECFYERDGKLHNFRQDKERKKQVDYKKTQAANGAKGGRPKKPTAISGLSEIKPTKSEGEPKKRSLSPSLSPTPVERPTDAQRARVRGPLHDTSHRNHAHCGRVCLPSALYGEFVRRRNHAGAERELDEWALDVEREWGTAGPQGQAETGDAFDFWRARYAEKWPAAAGATLKDGPMQALARASLDALHNRTNYGPIRREES